MNQFENYIHHFPFALHCISHIHIINHTDMREDTNSTNTIVPSLNGMNIAMNNENINRVLNWHGINQILNITKQSHYNDPLIISYSNLLCTLCYRQFISYKSGSIVILDLPKLDNANINATTIANNVEICKLLLLRSGIKIIKDNYGNNPINIITQRKYKCLFKVKNNAQIRQLHMAIKYIQTKHTLKVHNNHTVGLEKERIMGVEISTLKNQLNEIQYGNDIRVNKLNKCIGFVEDYIQTLSVSVEEYHPSTTIGNNALLSNILPCIQTGTKQVTTTKTPVETPLTELSAPVSNSNTLTNTDRDNKDLIIGLTSDDEYKIPSIRLGAKPLESGGFSEYDERDIVYITKRITPSYVNMLCCLSGFKCF